VSKADLPPCTEAARGRPMAAQARRSREPFHSYILTCNRSNDQTFINKSLLDAKLYFYDFLTLEPSSCIMAVYLRTGEINKTVCSYYLQIKNRKGNQLSQQDSMTRSS